MPTTATAPAAVIRFPKRAASTPRPIKNALSLKGLKPPVTGEVSHPVVGAPGLFLRVTANGVYTWSLRYTNPQGTKKRIVIGPLQDLDINAAKDKVSEHREMLRQGKDPAHVKTLVRTATLFGFLKDEWLTKKAVLLKGKGVRERQMLDGEFAHWNDRVADDIAKGDALAVLDKKTKAGKLTMHNRLLALLSRIYRWGILERGIVTVNPVVGIKKHKERGRKRVLAPDELVRIWSACDTQSIHVAVWMKLRLVTGQRGGELLLMRWDDINPRTHWWTIPGEFAKNEIEQPVYLTELARELLASLPRRTQDGPFDPVWVFPCGDTRTATGKVTKGANTAKLNVMGDYAKVARRLAQPSRANLVETATERKRDKRGWKTRETSTFRGHDLRRAMSTYVREAGVPMSELKLILNHADPEKTDGATGHYDRSTQQRLKRSVWEFWEEMLRVILSGQDVPESMRWQGVAQSDASKPTLVATQALLGPEQLKRLDPAVSAALMAIRNAAPGTAAAQ